MTQLAQDAAGALDSRIEEENLNGIAEAVEVRKALERLHVFSLGARSWTPTRTGTAGQVREAAPGWPTSSARAAEARSGRGLSLSVDREAASILSGGQGVTIMINFDQANGPSCSSLDRILTMRLSRGEGFPREGGPYDRTVLWGCRKRTRP
jgi:hypothetical protein